LPGCGSEVIVASRDRQTERNVALVGGAALIAWLFWRGKGWGFGADDGLEHGIGRGSPTTVPAAPCLVWIRANRIELDGVPVDLNSVVTRCREIGQADVRATGDAITRSIADVLRALKAAGVVVNAPPELVQLLTRMSEAA
jgi:hypothetical protein